ncbi:hypothetical protein MMC07_001361 [Pseudocyphellaria aurata]|nr:hypothetical protein [Pseudocyphellaria aurata]
MFNFTPLLGAQSSSQASQSLLELDGGAKILIDVGWDEDFEVEKLRSLERHVPSLSIILLTHATVSHLAAFAHCCKHFPPFTKIPIYATTPVISLGLTLLQDIYSSTPLASTIIPSNSLSESSYSYSSTSADGSVDILLQPPTSEEIASYFSLIHPLKYSQPHQPLPSPFSPPLNGLTITAYNAGHTLGGTIWHLQHGMESIVYAVGWNQIRENVFSGAAWLGSGGGGAEVIEQLRKPTALVCSTRGAERNPLAGGRKKRDDLLLEMIRTAVGKGGTVLIPTDTSARVLELAYLLEHAWRKAAADRNSDNPIKSSKLYLASRHVGTTMTFARSMLEWMDETVARELEAETTTAANRPHKRTDSKQNPSRDPDAAGKTTGPFDFQYLRLLERRKQIDKITSTKAPRVILASDSSLEWGFSKDVLLRIAAGHSNLIILTDEFDLARNTGETEGLGGTLWRWYQERRDGVAMEAGSDGQTLEQVHTGGRKLESKDAERIQLEGKELLVYQQYLATQRRLHSSLQTANGTSLETSADALDDASSTNSSSSDESDPEKQGKALNTSATAAHFNRNKAGLSKENLGVNILLRQPGVYDYDVRGKKGREQMFPFVTKRRRGDDFGEFIRPEDYLRAEERELIDGLEMRDEGSGKQTKFGQKRKWEDSGLQSDLGKRGFDGTNKRKQQGLNPNNSRLANGTNGDPSVNGIEILEEDELSDNEAEPEEPPVGPSKVTYKTNSVQANLKIAYVDFSGLHDQRSLSMLIPLIQPRKLVLVGGTVSETLSLAKDFLQRFSARSQDGNDKFLNDVYTPLNGQTINASVDTNAWTVKLSEALVRRFHWQNVRGLGIVTLMGHLVAATMEERPIEAAGKKRLKLLKRDAEEAKLDEIAVASDKAPKLTPLLDVLPPNLAAATRSVAQPLHVGDLRLADLRRILQTAGHTAEFRGEGTLLIDGLVAVRKSATGRVEVEGSGLDFSDLRARNLEGPFYTVKRKIYEGLAVVTGG